MSKRKRAERDETEDAVPLELLLDDAAAALEIVGMHGLARACLVANTILTGEPVLGEAMIADVVDCLDAAKIHANHNDEGSRVELIAAIDAVETFGLEPERRMRNVVRELTASLETIRQQAHAQVQGEHARRCQVLADAMAEIERVAERSLSMLGFEPYKPDETEEEEKTEDANREED